MKIKFGAIVVDGRGKLGGHVFSKNLGGAFMRTKVTPANPNTGSQAGVRALFGAISAQWSGLTAAQRSAWNTAVENWQNTNIFGDLKKPSGKALFQRLNNQAQSAGLAGFTAVPAKLEMPDDIVSAVDYDTTLTTITLTGANADASTQVVLWATPILTAGTSVVGAKLRQIYAVAGNVFVAGDAADAYEAKFGDPAAGANILFGIQYVLASGQASPMQIVKAVVAV
jgi:hypothetical protein